MWPGFCIVSCVLIMAFSPVKSNKLSVLDSDDGGVSPDSPQVSRWVDCIIRIFWSFGTWIMHSGTL